MNYFLQKIHNYGDKYNILKPAAHPATSEHPPDPVSLIPTVVTMAHTTSPDISPASVDVSAMAV
jgi:hypothetical protein